MIKTALTTTAAMALMTGLAFAQAKTDGGAQRSTASPTSANSGVSLSTSQTQPIPSGSYSSGTSVGQNSVNGSSTGGPATQGGAADTGQSANAGQPTTGSGTMPTQPGTATAMPVRSMPSTPSMMSNSPTGDAPTTYAFCTRKGQDRCKQRHSM